MKILVTGGAGFIGSQVAQAFVQAGHQVTVLDNLSSGKRENLPPQAEFVEADIASPQAAEAGGPTAAFEVIDHHAAQISVPASVADPVHDAQSNVSGPAQPAGRRDAQAFAGSASYFRQQRGARSTASWRARRWTSPSPPGP